MRRLSTDEIRKGFIKFFVEKQDHIQIPGSSIIPEDNSVLLTSAGMQQLIPFLMGKEHPQGGKLCSVQKCFRTTDIEEIGDESHGSFFEMLGNWSLGSYFKKEAIQMAYQYLTEELEIDPSKIHATIFEGDSDIPFDQQAKDFWLELGMPEDHIVALDANENFWIAGDTGPCGGDSEIYYDRGVEKSCGKASCKPGCDCDRYLEIWNLVFMEYNKQESITKLDKQNVDTGAGLARLAMLSQDVNTIYETDEIFPIIQKIEELTQKSYSDYQREMRIITDHIRASIVMMNTGIVPSNLGREYLLRRLIRRAVRYSRSLGYEGSLLSDLLPIAITSIQEEVNPDISTVLKNEEDAFSKTIQTGLRELEKIDSEEVDGAKAFYLYETYGFPLELTEEIIGRFIDKDQYNASQKAHQEVSKAGAQVRKGGVEDNPDAAINHTATHLLHQALKNVLGEDVTQRGSDVTAERLRFDFNYAEKMTPEQVKEVEDMVNTQINAGLEISKAVMTVDEAKSAGAIGVFDDKYADEIDVYSMGEFSKEICGGPHAKNTSELVNFKIQSEKSSSKGVRRIKAVTNQ